MERNAEADPRAFGSIGIEIAPTEVLRHEGRRSRERIEFVAREHGRELSTAERDAVTRRHQKPVAGTAAMPLYRGAEPLLRSLPRAGLRIALVTANFRENAERDLGPAVRFLDVLVTAEDVRRTAPDPEPYQTALERMRVARSSTGVVENAPLGIESARSAGIEGIAVTTPNPPGRRPGAAATVRERAEVLPTLRGLGWVVADDAARGPAPA